MAKRETNLSLYTQPDVQDKRVLLRVDLNVPLKDGQILDDKRIQAIVPTVKDLQAKGAKIILLSHLGRPKGETLYDPKLSLSQLCSPLKKAFSSPVLFHDDCIGQGALQASQTLKDGDILLLENLRFHNGETNNDSEFARQLSQLGDVYINDAFAVSHRAHASVVGIADHLPCFAGPLLYNEIKNLSNLYQKERHPLMAIVGGAKISSKINLLTTLVQKTQCIALGGGIANTFLAAQGYNMGQSLVEQSEQQTARDIMGLAQYHQCRIILPHDVHVASNLNPGAQTHIVPIDQIDPDKSSFDIGPQTIQSIKEALQTVQAVIWNGPVGLFEHKPFDQGSMNIAQAIAERTRGGDLHSIAGGGETAAVIKRAGVEADISFLSTGGGAFLEFIEGRTLPGLDVF